MRALPEAFAARMQMQLGSQYDAFLLSYERKVLQGLRVNTLKTDVHTVHEKLKMDFRPVPWCSEGLYVSEGQAPSHHPYYYAGLYYLQEPSAMAPAAFLPVRAGDRVLDLCAAPGGKSTQLAAKLGGKGLLVSNDLSVSRARALLKNLELFGARRVCVTAEAPYRLAERLPGYFSKILVDAPCSGEGMFHKEPSIMSNWEHYGSGYYAKLQAEILDAAETMLAPGGMLLYSTCTFSPEEDEAQIEDFLKRHPDFHLIGIPGREKIQADLDSGHPEWVQDGRQDLRLCLRLWPHRVAGEGHFLALLQKDGETSEMGSHDEQISLPAAAACWWDDHVDEAALYGAGLVKKQDSLFVTAVPEDHLKGIRVLRNGLLLGELKKDRFEPSQALAMTLSESLVRQTVRLDPETAVHYLKGESISGTYPAGWYLVTVDGFPLGWGKGAGTFLKNKYLKGWRYLS